MKIMILMTYGLYNLLTSINYINRLVKVAYTYKKFGAKPNTEIYLKMHYLSV